MNTARLIALGELAGDVRRRIPQNTGTLSMEELKQVAQVQKEYDHYITCIDAETQVMRLSYPNKFWHDGTPAYKELTDVWDAKRAEMKASGVKLPSYIAEQRKKPTSERKAT